MEGSYDGFIKDNSIESKCYFASLLQQTSPATDKIYKLKLPKSKMNSKKC